jgi:hypothetical protein
MRRFALITFAGVLGVGGMVVWSNRSARTAGDNKEAVASQLDETSIDAQASHSATPSNATPKSREAVPIAETSSIRGRSAPPLLSDQQDDPKTVALLPPIPETIAHPRAAEEPSPASREPSSRPEVFGPEDGDVVQPVPMYPQQLGRLPAGTRGEDMAIIEVVVNSLGTVDSAKVVEAPATLEEALVMTMSLSAAKTWHFRPARRDGQNVSYRQRLRVALH